MFSRCYFHHSQENSIERKSAKKCFTQAIIGTSNLLQAARTIIFWMTNFSKESAWQEARQLINLAIPTVIVQLGANIPPALTASYVGRHLGSTYLDGFTLANLTGNLCTLSLLSGLYSASDTLAPQAFGAGNYRELGLLLMRGLTGSMIVLIPINLVLLMYMEQLLILCGQDPVPSALAAKWYSIYLLSLPFYALYMVTWKFLSAQAIMTPLVVILIVTLLSLPLLLETFVTRFGFLGSALAILTYMLSQAILLVAYLWWQKPHTPDSWPGLGAWGEALAWKPFVTYMSLGLGGILSASEWIYWEMLGIMIGKLGQVPLAVHTVPTQVLMVAFMVPLGLGIALSIRLGQVLPRSVTRAKQLLVWTFIVAFILVSGISGWLYIYRNFVFHIFTNEDQVLKGCESIWPQVVFYNWTLSISAISMGAATGLGMQWTLGFVTFTCLWVVGMPGLWYFAIHREGGIEVAWNWIYPPYMAMNTIMCYYFYIADWDAISKSIRIREGIDSDSDSDQDRTISMYGAMDTSLILKPEHTSP